MQSFITDKDFPCSVKLLHGSSKIVSAKFRWCLTFDTVYIMDNMIQHDSKTLPLQSHSIPGKWSKCKNSFLSESGHIAYQIKKYEAQRKMQARTLTLHRP